MLQPYLSRVPQFDFPNELSAQEKVLQTNPQMQRFVAAGNIVATSTDPLLLNWTKIVENPVIPLADADDMDHPYRVYDPCIWSEEDGYYALSGSYIDGRIFGNCRMAQHLFFSKDLSRWTYLGPFIEGAIFTAAGKDGAVPYFWPIGDRHILVFASHQRGSQYLIGDYDRTRHCFRPTAHRRFHFGPIHHGGMHAPSATPDGQGGLYMIHNINHGRPTQGWDHIMSLVRHVSVDAHAALKIELVHAIEYLCTSGTYGPSRQ